jgi:hypothetical protein
MAASFRLSNEELALVSSLLGKPGCAYSFLGIADRDVNILEDDVEHARLLTAGHGLMARYAMSIGADGSVRLSDTLVHIGTVITAPDYCLDFSRTDDSGEWHTAFHFYKGQIWEHFTEFGVVHEIQEIADIAQVRHAADEFFDLPANDENAAENNPPNWQLAMDTLEKFLEGAANNNAEETVGVLTQGGLPAEVAQALTTDVSQATMKGSIFRNEYDDGVIISAQGCLFVKGPASLWLIEVPPLPESSGKVIIQRFTRAKLHQLFAQWTSGQGSKTLEWPL